MVGHRDPGFPEKVNSFKNLWKVSRNKKKIDFSRFYTCPGGLKMTYFRYILILLKKPDFEWAQKLFRTTISGNVNNPLKRAHFDLFNELLWPKFYRELQKLRFIDFLAIFTDLKGIFTFILPIFGAAQWGKCRWVDFCEIFFYIGSPLCKFLKNTFFRQFLAISTWKYARSPPRHPLLSIR